MYKEFAICQIFEKIQTEKVRAKANDFPENKQGEYIIPLLTAGINNQGLARYAKREQCPTILKNVLSVSANGANSGAVFYQPNEFAVLQDAYAIRPIEHEICSEAEGLFLATILNKSIRDNHSWVNKAGWNNIKNDPVSLPIKNDGTPDWFFMAERIKELEAERIKELEAYLLATGLDDYELTEEDKKALKVAICGGGEAISYKNNQNSDELRWKKFRLGDLFLSDKGDVDLQQKDINNRGCFFINSGVENFGIKGRTDRIAKIFPANTITIDFWGNAYYRDFEYKLATHNHVFSLSGDVIKNREVGLFLVSQMRGFTKIFSYDNMATWNKLKEMTISLPVGSDDLPNWDFMERYIRATEKLVIAEVVKWKDKIIETTKSVVCQ